MPFFFVCVFSYSQVTTARPYSESTSSPVPTRLDDHCQQHISSVSEVMMAIRQRQRWRFVRDEDGDSSVTR